MPAPRTVKSMLVLGLASLSLSSACHKRPSGPSPHYDKAAQIHQTLYVQEIDDAYLDPRMDEAVSELKQVPADSVSARPAADLLAQIAKGKKDAQAARDAANKELAASAQGPSIDPSRVLGSGIPSTVSPLPPPAPVELDAGPAPLDPYGPGAPIAEINRATGGCLMAGAPFNEQGSGKVGISYRVVDDPACKSKLPGFANQVVLAVDGRIYRRVAASELKTQAIPIPGGPATDATTPAARALAGGAPSVPASQQTAGQSPPDNVAQTQNATPSPVGGPAVSPAAGAPTTAASPGTSVNAIVSPPPNVAQEQDATPRPVPPNDPNSPVQDATPPPAQ